MFLLITGATGLLGQALARECRRRGIGFAGLSRLGSDIAVDLTDEAAAASALSTVPFTACINAAALTNLDECERDRPRAKAVNAEAAAFLAELCRTRKARFIQISTDHFYTGHGDRKHREDEPLELLNEYARTKRAGEEATLARGGLVVRTNIVGFRNWATPTFVEWVLRQLEEGSRFTGFTDAYFNTLDVRSAAQNLLDLLHLNPFPSGVLNLASRTVVSKADFIAALARKGGYDLQAMVMGSVRDLGGVPRAESLGLDVAKAEALLGRKLPDLEAVIDSLWSEYQERKHELRP